MNRENFFTHLVVLAPPTTAQPLIRYFMQLNARLSCSAAGDAAELDRLSQACGGGARLVSFGTDLLVPPAILARFAFGAYNFHPGPPAYPGWAPASFALYDGATTFGATLHRMVEQVDAGQIVGTELFVVGVAVSADLLSTQSTAAMARLLKRLGWCLANQSDPLAPLPIVWGENRGSKAKATRLRALDGAPGEEERARRRHAFSIAEFVYPDSMACQPGGHGVPASTRR
jgi:hypothetical protein